MRITLKDRHPESTVSWFHGSESMIAGAGAGLVSSVITCPLDVVKTKLQATRHHKDGLSTLSGTVRHVWESEGLRGFYRGLGPTILGYLPTWAIYFTVYDAVKQRMSALRAERTGRDSKADPLVHIIAAMSAGASGTICTNPLWVVKTRFMTQDVASGEPRYRNTWDALRRIYVAEGIAAFYRGMVPSLLGVSHVAVQFPLYEQFKNLYRPADGSDISASTILVCSASSKMIASVATYPHEVLRTRMQLGKQHAGEVAARGHRVELALEGLMDTSRRIWAEAGLVGFYRGLSINLVRTIPNSALTILTYELLMRHLTSLTRPRSTPT